MSAKGLAKNMPAGRRYFEVYWQGYAEKIRDELSAGKQPKRQQVEIRRPVLKAPSSQLK